VYLFVTCDKIGSPTGGGVVTKYELDALSELGQVDIFNPAPTHNPFDTEHGYERLNISAYKLAHFYAGTYPNLTTKLREAGVKITYTAAAHDVNLSKQEYEACGVPFDYPHLTDPQLWGRYLSSYYNADLIICPSHHSANVMRGYGCKSVEVIPHGCHAAPLYALPKTYSVGYLGQIGPDKGVKYLIEAWEKLRYKDAVLTIAGSQSPHLLNIIRNMGAKSNYNILGYVNSLDEFFKSINIYVQPSVTEGFGIEILEAMAYGRPVIASRGAGAADCINDHCTLIPSRDSKSLANAIDHYRINGGDVRLELVEHSRRYDWSVIKARYVSTWKKLLSI
jgi:glycosyltransferase involved in cell wall biosynthesis